MSYTKFGEYVRVLRVKNHEVMGDMAKALGVAIPFLSAVECGKKNVPKEWVDVISRRYHLSEGERADLIASVEESRTQVKMNLVGSNNYQRKAAISFARSFEDMDEETANKIIDLLENK